jgi:hypothetical protein
MLIMGIAFGVLILLVIIIFVAKHIVNKRADCLEEEKLKMMANKRAMSNNNGKQESNANNENQMKLSDIHEIINRVTNNVKTNSNVVSKANISNSNIAAKKNIVKPNIASKESTIKSTTNNIKKPPQKTK